jgi:uncharacterized coiled-coil DUF342 family protein
MDFHQLDILEEKIKKMLVTMNELQSENQALLQKNEENEKAIRKLRLDLEKWSQSAEENSSLIDQIEFLKKERDEIKVKVERLISHLESLEAKV